MGNTNSSRTMIACTIVLILAFIGCNGDRSIVGDAGEILRDAGRALLDASSDAAQAQDTCTNWEFREETYDPRMTTPLPEGWEPFATRTPSGSGNVYVGLRRCVM